MFSDPPAQFDKADIDTVLAHAQEQCALLASLEREMARNKEYLAKVSYTCPDLHTFFFRLCHSGTGSPRERAIQGPVFSLWLQGRIASGG